MDFYTSSDLLCKFYHFLITSSIPFSALVMVAIAIDRYLCICRPFARWFSLPRAKLIVCLLAAFVTCLGVCVSLMYGIVPARHHIFGKHFTHILNYFNQSGIQSINESEAGQRHDRVGHDLLNSSTESSRNSRLNEDPQYSARPQSNVEAFKPIETMLQQIKRKQSASSETEYVDYLLSDSSSVTVSRCWMTETIVSQEFALVYQKFYTGMFLACLIVVSILYVLIYRSVLVRRSRRRKQKSASLSMQIMSRTTLVMISPSKNFHNENEAEENAMKSLVHETQQTEICKTIRRR